MSNFNRRKFIKSVMLGTCGAAIHNAITPNKSFLAFADPLSTSNLTANGSVLILVNLAGGASYNIAPVYHGTYRDKNPNISYGPDDSIPIHTEQGLHPSLTEFKTIWDEGNLGLVNMVGYPSPNRSHAESTDIWFRGNRFAAGDQSGWAARLTCQLGGLFSGVSLSGGKTLTNGSCNPPRAINSLNSLGEKNHRIGGEWLRNTRDALLLTHNPAPNTNFAFVKGEMDSVNNALSLLQSESNVELPAIDDPFPDSANGFVGRCKDAARLIAASGLQTRFIYLERGGFDTHSNERDRLTNNLDDINLGLGRLIRTLKALGRWNNTTIVTMSEFCRTFENGSAGTDHGHAAPMYVLGGGVKGGIKTPVPTPAETQAYAYYRDYHVDFREVFKEITGAMGLNSELIFPEQIRYSNLDLV